MRAVLLLAALVLLPLLAPPAAATTQSCQLVGHGAMIGLRTDSGCTVSGVATYSVEAVVSVTIGTVDAIEIEMLEPSGARHVFLCTFQLTEGACFFPVRVTDAVDGTWRVTARIVAVDVAGPLSGGPVETYARLDATFL